MYRKPLSSRGQLIAISIRSQQDRVQQEIGLLSSDGHRWTAGVLFLHNLIYALRSLSGEERRDVHLFLGPRDCFAHHEDVPKDYVTRHAFAYSRKSSCAGRLAGSLLLVGRGRRPCSLESVAASSGVGVLYPVHQSLGPDFPIPWIGWIPDFQHNLYPEYFSQSEIDERHARHSELIQDASRIILSSEVARSHCARFYPASLSKTDVHKFCSAIPPAWFDDDPKEAVRAYKLPEKYLMFPSQFWKHKNHRLMFEAIRALRDRGLKDVCLVCTGHPP